MEKITYSRVKDGLRYRLLKFLSNFIDVYVPGTIVYPGRVLGDGNWGTHVVPLISAVINSKGPILELGAGDYSTPLLHALCKKEHRFLLSTDTDKQWLELFRDLETTYHKLHYVSVYEDDKMLNPKPEKWDDIGNDQFWGVVLVDHRPAERRRVEIERLKKNTNIFVVHDSEQLSYQYEDIFATFKYRYDYSRYRSRTTLISNETDVAKLFID